MFGISRVQLESITKHGWAMSWKRRKSMSVHHILLPVSWLLLRSRNSRLLRCRISSGMDPAKISACEGGQANRSSMSLTPMWAKSLRITHERRRNTSSTYPAERTLYTGDVLCFCWRECPNPNQLKLQTSQLNVADSKQTCGVIHEERECRIASRAALKKTCMYVDVSHQFHCPAPLITCASAKLFYNRPYRSSLPNVDTGAGTILNGCRY